MRPWLTSNTGLKVVALVLATLTWIFVNNITSEIRVIEGVAIEPTTSPALNVQNLSEPSVNITLRGAHADLWQVSRSDLTAVIDLRTETLPGKVHVTLKPESIQHPPRVQVTQVVPARISVWLVNATSTNAP